MKSRLLIIQLSGAVASLALLPAAWGQMRGGSIDRPFNTPAFSPYLNMLRSDSGPAQNYYGLVRPQLEFARQNQQLSAGLESLQTQQNSMMQPMGQPMMGYGYSQLGMTGHPVIFNSFGTSQFSGGYTGTSSGMMGGGFGGGMMGGGGGGFAGPGFAPNSMGAGGMNSSFNGMSGSQGGGFSPYGGMSGPAMGLSGMSGGSMTGHASQFGGIGNMGQPGMSR
jgi:hypothetical protein